MIFHPKENGIFVRNFNEHPFKWSGEYIGDITNLVNKIPAVKGRKLFYASPANQYVILEKYDTKTHIIEMIKRVLCMYSVPYNICTYKKKNYFMYLYVPFNEIEYSYGRKKKEDITEEERKIFFLHYILGVKGKTVRIYVSSENNGYNGDFIVLSNGRYSNVDYDRNTISSNAINKFFGDYQTFYNTSLFFKDDLKIDMIRNLMSQENYWWFQEIEKRIEQLVSIKK